MHSFTTRVENKQLNFSPVSLIASSIEIFSALEISFGTTTVSSSRTNL